MVRLYVKEAIFQGVPLSLSQDHLHYLKHVLRYSLNQDIVIFNESDGEWVSTIQELTKSVAIVLPKIQKRAPVLENKIHLIFSPLKHEALLYLIEKTTELGVTNFHPTLMERTNIHRINLEKLQKNAVEACQQCERFSPPHFSNLTSVTEKISSWNSTIPILCCQERGEALPILTCLQNLPKNQEVAFFIGPEGGITEAELRYLKTFPFIHFITLGSRILRAETAAVAAVSCAQAVLEKADSRFCSHKGANTESK